MEWLDKDGSEETISRWKEHTFGDGETSMYRGDIGTLQRSNQEKAGGSIENPAGLSDGSVEKAKELFEAALRLGGVIQGRLFSGWE